MARTTRRALALAIVTLFAAPLVSAQLSNLPDLSTATQTTGDSSTAASTTQTTAESTTADASTSLTTDSLTSFIATTTSAASETGSLTTSSGSVFHLTGLPTIEGAGIPTLVIPYTADAPFMKKSDYPEGTVFIVIGAILAFLGACVILWRGLIAWSVNRSVKKAALATIGRGEKNSTNWGTGAGYNPANGSFYKDAGMTGSSMSLDALTSTGMKKGHFKDHATERSSTPPQNLFFSPTAQARQSVQDLRDAGNRNSSYLPAGYYASPSAQAAGGANSTTIGGSLAPYARNSQIGLSPPASPGLAPTSRSSATYRGTSREGLSRDGLRPSSTGYGPPSRESMRPASRDNLSVNRDGYGPSSARNSYIDPSHPRSGHNSQLYAQPSSSSLMVGLGQRPSNDGLAGSRAPSAYLEDLFENHGNGPRERF